jgi:hypothetical protein
MAAARSAGESLYGNSWCDGIVRAGAPAVLRARVKVVFRTAFAASFKHCRGDRKRGAQAMPIPRDAAADMRQRRSHDEKVAHGRFARCYMDARLRKHCFRPPGNDFCDDCGRDRNGAPHAGDAADVSASADPQCSRLPSGRDHSIHLAASASMVELCWMSSVGREKADRVRRSLRSGPIGR